jgi:hypothetical protein
LAFRAFFQVLLGLLLWAIVAIFTVCRRPKWSEFWKDLKVLIMSSRLDYMVAATIQILGDCPWPYRYLAFLALALLLQITILHTIRQRWYLMPLVIN